MAMDRGSVEMTDQTCGNGGPGSPGRERVRRESTRPGSRGFTLLELLIAMTILAIGLLGIMKLQMQSGFGNVHSRQQSAAVNLARSKMEEIKRIGAWSIQGDPITGQEAIPALMDTDTSYDLDNWSSPDFSEGPLNEDEDSSNPRGKIYTRAWNVVHDYPIPDFKTIRVRVSWTTGGQYKYVELETQIGKKDLQYFN